MGATARAVERARRGGGSGKRRRSLPLLNAALARDPTRTTSIRLKFTRSVNVRLGDLKRDIRTSIVDQDCFGIIAGNQPPRRRLNVPTQREQFRFETAPRKVELFMEWLRDQEARGILEVIERPDRIVGPGSQMPWTNPYIRSSYVRGVEHAKRQAERYGLPVQPDLFGDPFIGNLGGPMHAERLAAVYTRTFEDLKTVMSQADAQIRRQLADDLTMGLTRGLAEGKNPITIAREMMRDANSTVDKIGVVRARLIARTEVLRAHHVGQHTEYEQLERMLGQKLKYTWVLGANPCDQCISMARVGGYTLDEVALIPPLHPQCVCTIILDPSSLGVRGNMRFFILRST